jgi:diguanylate cyclase (GGDEF)-like protein
MKRQLEIVLVSTLSAGAIGLFYLGWAAQQSLTQMLATQIDWPKRMHVIGNLHDAMANAEKGNDAVAAEKALKHLDAAAAEIKADKSKVDVDAAFNSARALLEPRPSDPAKYKEVVSALAGIEKSIFEHDADYMKERRKRLGGDAVNRSWFIIFVGFETLFCLGLSVYCLGERSKQQQLLAAVNAQLEEANKALDSLSQTDPLTALLNRRGLQNALIAERSRANRNKRPAVVVLIDCDDFKQINESFGHTGGDEVLRVLAARIKDVMRTTDHSSRVGGDEFVILCPETDLTVAKPLLERLLAAISTEPIKIKDREAMVTVSIGAAELPGEQCTVDDILALTRESLAASKQSGKNAVNFSG